MAEPFRCPACRRRLKIDPESFRRGSCPACGTKLVMNEEGRIAVRAETAPTAEGLLAGALKEEPAVLFCGAGVSMGPPTLAPSWWTLTKEVLRAVFTAAPVELPELAFQEIDRRPEEILESFAAILGDDFPKIFQVLDRHPLNPSQRAIARLCKAGRIRALFTTNFDRYLEKALEQEGLEYTRLVSNEEYVSFLEQGMPGLALCKLHGTIDQPETIVYVASQYRAARGFSQPKAALFARYLEENPVVFLGYSGWDFDHSNYEAFWQRVGPRSKRVLFNRRPGETGGPDLKRLLAGLGERLEFTTAELPEFVLKAGRIAKVETEDLASEGQPEQEEAQREAGKRRRAFWADWVREIPKPYLVGLCITDAATFSEQNQRMRARWMQPIEVGVALDAGKKVQDLAEQIRAGEITHAEYQSQIEQLSLDNLLATLPRERREHVRERAMEAAREFNEQSERQLFYSYLASYARNLETGEAFKYAAATTRKHLSLQQAGSRESRLMLNTLPVEAALSGLAPEQFRAARQELLLLVRQAVHEEIDEATFLQKVSELSTRFSQRQLGLPDYEELFKALVREALAHSELEEAVNAVAITMLVAAGWQSSAVSQTPAYTELVTHLARHPGTEVPLELLDRLDEPFNARLAPLLRKLPSGEAGQGNWRKIDAGICATLIQALQWIGGGEAESAYLNALRTGDYPRRQIEPSVASYLLSRFEPVWDALEELPERMFFPLCGHAALLAEMADDFALCEEAVTRALGRTEGKMNEQIPAPIPECLAAFYERRGELESAAHYYELALTGLKLAVPRDFADAIVYRAFRVATARNQPAEALRIARAYSPAYGEAETWQHLPCRDMLLAEVEQLEESGVG